MNIIITGTSRGIGFELVRYFAAMDDVVVFAISRKAGNFSRFKLGQRSSIKPVLFDINSIDTQSDFLISKLPKNTHIDILINNAGYLTNKPFKEIEKTDIEAMLNVNCIAPVLLIKTLLPLMGGKSLTHVINISSMGGFQGSVKFPGLSWYSASKAALACLTECLQAEYDGSDISFNCLALGAVQTEMLAEAFPGYKAPLKPEEMAEFIGEFALKGGKIMRGKIIPVSLSTP